MRLAAYGRVSGQRQEREETIKVQREQMAQYAEANGIEITGWYLDEPASSLTLLRERKEGSRLIEDLTKGRFDGVLIYTFDRIGRDYYLSLNAAELWKLAPDMPLVSVKERRVQNNREGRQQLRFLSMSSGETKDSINVSTVDGRLSRAKAGGWLGGKPPFGYKVVGYRRDAHLEIDETPIPDLPLNWSPADVIRRVFEWFVRERLSTIKVAARLNDLRVPTANALSKNYFSNGRWRPGQISFILTNPAYKGRMNQTCQGERFVYELSPIISSEMWEQAQPILAQNRNESKRNSKREYLFRGGLVRCGMCGQTCSGGAHGPKGNIRNYRCRGYSDDSGYRVRCPNSTHVNAAILERLIWQEMVGFLVNPDRTLLEISRQMALIRSGQDPEVEVRGAQAAFADLDRRWDTAVDLATRRRISEEDLEKQHLAIEEERQRLRQTLDQLAEMVSVYRSKTERLRSAEILLKSFQENLKRGLTYGFMQLAVQTFCLGVFIYPGRDEDTGRRYIDVERFYLFDGPVDAEGRPIGRRSRLPVNCYRFAKARRMPDFGDDEWQRMLCIETGSMVNPITLAPAREWKGETVLRVE